jgi:putative glycosyl hydrolase-like family 15 (GHL15) protein
MLSRVSGHGAVLAVAAALVTAGTSSAASPTGADTAFAPTTEGIHRVLSMQMYGTRIPDASTALKIAMSHDIVSMNKGQLGTFGPAMKAANANLRIFLYLNGMFAQKNQGTMFPEAWYMKAADGSKIRSAGYGNYLMDPRSTVTFSSGGVTYAGWGDYVAKRCNAMLTSTPGSDGCFVDMLGTAPLMSFYNVGRKVPAADAKGTPFTTTRWYTEIAGPISAGVERVTGKPVVANGIGSGRRYFGTSYGPSRMLLDFATAGDAEVWLRAPGQSLAQWPTDAVWRTEVQMLSHASGANRAVNATVKTWVAGTTAQKDQWRRFGLGSFLIGNGGHASFEFTGDEHQAPWADNSPLYRLALGAPTETFADVASYQRGGVYRRAFANGTVLVNTGEKPVTVDLGTPHLKPDGTTVTSIPVPAHDASFLTLS